MFARTERLLLRPGWIEDAPALALAIGDVTVVRNLAQVPCPYTLADAEAYLSRDGDPRLPQFLMFARTNAAPRLVGGIGLHGDDGGAPELGFWVARRFWGLGFATEAGRAVVALAHHSLGIGGLAAGHFTDNPGSGHVLRKLGFRATGATRSRYSVARGIDVPCMLFARASTDVIGDADAAWLAA